MFKYTEARLPKKMTHFSSDIDKTLIFILNSIISMCPLKFLYLLISSLQITLNIRNTKLSELGNIKSDVIQFSKGLCFEQL